MAGPLAQGVRHLGTGAKVFRRLRDADPFIEEALATRPTATESNSEESSET
jgi:hypothetical protein